MLEKTLFLLSDSVFILWGISKQIYSLFAGPVRYKKGYVCSEDVRDSPPYYVNYISIEYENGKFKCPFCGSSEYQIIERWKNIDFSCFTCRNYQRIVK
jgi:hypothetical protein